MVILVAGVIALSWAWGSVMAMQKNYELQQELDLKNRDKLVAEIQYETYRGMEQSGQLAWLITKRS